MGRSTNCEPEDWVVLVSAPMIAASSRRPPTPLGAHGVVMPAWRRELADVEGGVVLHKVVKAHPEDALPPPVER